MNKKILLFFGILIIGSNGHANKVPKENIELNKNPAIAKTLAIGRVIESKEGAKFFIGERGWTTFPARHFLRDKVNEAQRLVTYDVVEKYIFYSNKKTASNGQLDENAYFNLIPLKSDKAKELIKNLAGIKNAGIPNPSWQYCELDSECKVIKNYCEKSISVNKKFENDFLNFLKSKNLETKCKNHGSQDLKPNHSKCFEKFCT